MSGFEIFITVFLIGYVVFMLIMLMIRWYGKRKGLAIIISLIKGSRHKEAKKQLDYYLRYFPKSKRAWALLGAVELELENLQQAKTAFEKSIDYDPMYSYALTGLGVIYRREKRFDKAEDCYYRALRSNPNDYRAKSSLMLLELYKGNADVAISLGEDSIRNGLDSVEPVVVGNLAVAYHTIDEFDKRDELIEYLRLNEYMGLYYLMLFFEDRVTIEMMFDMGV
ncbi:MAG: tetratricopeptide repeat protein [Bacteroidota bacterium]